MEAEKALQTIDVLIQKQQYRKISEILQNMIDIEIQQKKSIQEIVGFFNKIYDKLYYYIVFDKFDMDKSLIKQLESLAMPLQSKSEEEWKKLLEALRKAKK